VIRRASHTAEEQFVVAEIRLSADRRTEFGKGGARRTRRAGKIPAVLYGHGADPQHLALPVREFTQAVKKGGSNVLLTLDIEGSEALAIPKALQRHVIRNGYEHVDLLAVRSGEKIVVDIALTVTGEVASGGLLQQEQTSVSVEAEATHIPTDFAVNVEGAEIGTQITAADLDLPAGVTLAGDPEQILVLVSEAPTAEQLDAEAEEAAAELGIEQQQPESESAGDAGEGAAAPAGE
jgi:large subunit ribosomal protein L25